MIFNDRKNIHKLLAVIAACYLILSVLSPQEDSHRGLSTEKSIRKNGKKTKNDGRERTLQKSQHEMDLEEEHFNQSNPHTPWCPNALCSNSPMCSPCDRRFLFIVATGRSGSTTLLDMFDALPGVRLAGENWGELNIAADLDTNLKQGWFKGDEMGKGPFKHNPVHEQSLACVHQHLIHALNPPTPWMQHFGEEKVEEYDAKTIIGFKTIRVHDKDWSPKEAADYFKENFPCSRIIVNIRDDDIEGQVQSMMRFFHESNWTEVEQIVEHANVFLEEFAAELGPQTGMLLHLHEWKNNVGPLNTVMDWMGFEGCSFKEIIHENHNDYELNQNGLDLGENCRYPYDPAEIM